MVVNNNTYGDFVQRIQNSINPLKTANSIRFKLIAKLKSSKIMQYLKYEKNSDNHQREH